MTRLVYVVPFALALLACGSKSSDTPDAAVILTTDAHPPDAPPPDAFSCSAPLMECSAMECTDVSNDEQNCGACGTVCKGGEFCSATTPKGCTCPEAFVPSNRAASGLDVIQYVAQFNLGIGFGPINNTTRLDGLLAVVAPDTDVTKTYDLSKSGGSLLSPPMLVAAYNVTQGGGALGFSADAFYKVTSGTLKFDVVCTAAAGGEIKGTLTDATFSGATISTTTGSVTVDPDGCTFQVAKLTFDIKKDGTCP
jgi:hypothetical protein